MALLSPLRARSTSWRSSSSLWAFCAAVAAGRAAIWLPPRSGVRRKSHPKVEGEHSKVRWTLQEVCNGPRMLRTYVRVGQDLVDQVACDRSKSRIRLAVVRQGDQPHRERPATAAPPRRLVQPHLSAVGLARLGV